MKSKEEECMKIIFKPFIFILLACTLLLGAGISAEAVSKPSGVAINNTNFSEELMIYADDADKNKDGYLSAKETADVTRISLESNKNTDIFKGIQYFTELETFKFDSYVDRRNPEEIGEAELSDIIVTDKKNRQYALYEFNEDYLIKLRALEGKYGSLKWDAWNRRVYFDITEGTFDNYFTSQAGSSFSEDERLGLANKNSDIEYLSFRGQVKNFIPNGVGIVEADYKNSDTVILKGKFPEGVAEGRFISYKTNGN